MAVTQDTEITLGTGKLLGIFFVLVALCSLFFILGYLLGRGSPPGTASTAVVTTVPGGNSAGKPSAGANKAPDTTGNCPAGSANCTPASTGPDSSLYTSVSGKGPAATQPSAVSSTKPPDDASSTASAADTKNASAGSYMVQVAAVSKQEDADILVNALRKKQYPVFVVSNVPGDSLFHVQVGPFSDPKEAEAMRSRLAGDGYNAIVKK